MRKSMSINLPVMALVQYAVHYHLFSDRMIHTVMEQLVKHNIVCKLTPLTTRGII